MKIFHIKLFHCYNNSILHKTILLLTILLFCLFDLSAQKESNIKVKIETGILWTSNPYQPLNPGISGLFLNVEPKLKTSKNSIIGLRIGAALQTQLIKNSDPNQFFIVFDVDKRDNIYGISGNEAISIVPTFDYYFNTHKFRPYLGFGLGYYFLTSSSAVSRIPRLDEEFKLSTNNQVGLLLRGGLDIAKLTVGLELNFIPKADVKIPNGETIGTIKNSYIGLSFGYTLGLKKHNWKY